MNQRFLNLLFFLPFFMMVSESIASDVLKSSGLELKLSGNKVYYRSEEPIYFNATLHNLSEKGILLNGGELLGNGNQIWSSLKCSLFNKSKPKKKHPLFLNIHSSPIGGRIYFLGIPLGPRSRYKLSINTVGNNIPIGNYEISCTYEGKQSPYRDSTQLPKCWEGTASSNIFSFEVAPRK